MAAPRAWPRAYDPASRLAARRWPWWLAGSYLAFSAAWIVFSDLLVAGWAVAPAHEQQLQSIKGLLFVLATSGLLFFLARRAVTLLIVDRDLVSSLLTSVPVAVVAVDLEGIVRLWNPEAERLFGWTADEVIGEFLPILPEGSEEQFRRHLADTAAGLFIRQREIRRRHRDGGTVDVELSNTAVRDAAGNVIGAVGLFTDRGPRKRAEQTIRLHAAALEATASAVLLADTSLEVEWANRAFCELTGYAAGEVQGRDLAELLWGRSSRNERRELEAAVVAGEPLRTRGVHRRRDGTSYLAELTVSPVGDEDGRTTHLVAVQEDVSRTVHLAEQIRFLASYDKLTELPNRSLFLDRVGAMAVEAIATRQEVALAVGSIDRFHRLRQGLGRAGADDLVRSVGARLRDAVGDDGELAAFGGGLFAIARLASGAESELARTLARLRKSAEVPLVVEGRDIYPQVSFGCAIFPRDGVTFEDALHRAETALTLGIEQGRPIFLFEDRLQTSIDERVVLEGELRAGLSRRELFLEYQAVIDLRHDTVAIAEALVRWQHPRHGILAPGRFLPAAAEAGLMPRLDHWVLRHAAGAWLGGVRHPAGAIAVNLASHTLEEESLLSRLTDLTRLTGFQPGDLILEITETAAMRQPARTMALLEKVRALGFRIAIDDFGVAYSSLNYLRHLPAAFLKIDRSFVNGLGTISRDERLVGAILALAEDYGMEVIAEGVEEPAQLHWLREHGCRYAQGYLLGTPGPAEALQSWGAAADGH
ncbi:MAG TPA: EAL domain-containing protein [Thermoanaerobaculia bacterium]|nr:EAL domain-containing protein [Thermoanaerobaculia bacterium]